VVVIGVLGIVVYRVLQKKQMAQRKRKMATTGKTMNAHMLYLGGGGAIGNMANGPSTKTSERALKQADSFKAPPAAKAAPAEAAKASRGKAAFAPEPAASTPKKAVKKESTPRAAGPAW
jgi:hypothetical protein